ncbi:TPA: hypothetical protein QDZ58_000421 [Pluralibacter gergoviae]|nr:hypothetical protein [Pluralibacter gergoviae]
MDVLQHAIWHALKFTISISSALQQRSYFVVAEVVKRPDYLPRLADACHGQQRRPKKKVVITHRDHAFSKL